MNERLFEQAGLGIRPVHDCEITRSGSSGRQVLLDGIHNKGCLGNIIHGGKLNQFISLSLFGEKMFGGTVLIAVDDLTGGIQQVLGGAIILLQQDDLAILEIFLEALHIAIICAAPAVNGLVLIPDHEEVLVEGT